jgi:hypothetical protein
MPTMEWLPGHGFEWRRLPDGTHSLITTLSQADFMQNCLTDFNGNILDLASVGQHWN